MSHSPNPRTYHKSQMTLPAGFMLDEYRILKVLGQGGFGITYLAQDTRMRLDVAIKELLPAQMATRLSDFRVVPRTDLAGHDFVWAKERFLQEAQMLVKLNHPNIVRVYRFFEANRTAYFVMEFVPGQLAEKWMQAHPHPSENQLRALLLPLLDGLEYVHQGGLLHRDLSPENIIISKAGRPMLLDFGSARSILGAKRKLTEVVRAGYSPIEQYQTGATQGAYTDLYAVAGVMVRAITGKIPPVSVERCSGPDPFQPLVSRFRGRYSENFLKAIDSAFAPLPERRPQSVAAWRRMLGDSRPPKVNIVASKHGRKPALIVAGALVVIGSVIFAVIRLGTPVAPIVTPPVGLTDTAAPAFENASQEHPWKNSLEMEFVPVPGTKVLFCVWDTRVQDFSKFVEQTHYDATGGMSSLETDGWNKKHGATWREPGSGFNQGPAYPVVGVNWNDAKAFCDWLTKIEHAKGLLPQDAVYRLPTDEEWSIAVGLGNEDGDTPEKKDTNSKIKGYPWGSQWPPPNDAGNYAGRELKIGHEPKDTNVISDYSDGWPRTSPVGKFAANGFGLYDMSGNAWQWCEDRFNDPTRSQTRVLRGGSWSSGGDPGDLRSSFRWNADPDYRCSDISFRCVVGSRLTR